MLAKKQIPIKHPHLVGCCSLAGDATDLVTHARAALYRPQPVCEYWNNLVNIALLEL